jgi:hypothetical protein
LCERENARPLWKYALLRVKSVRHRKLLIKVEEDSPSEFNRSSRTYSFSELVRLPICA